MSVTSFRSSASYELVPLGYLVFTVTFLFYSLLISYHAPILGTTVCTHG